MHIARIGQSCMGPTSKVVALSLHACAFCGYVKKNLIFGSKRGELRSWLERAEPGRRPGISFLCDIDKEFVVCF